MKQSLLLLLTLCLVGPALAADSVGKSAAELEKEKAMKEPFANDFGPETLPEKYLKTLSADAQKGYKALRVKCAQCHSAARPLNSQFVETGGKDKAAREAAAAKLQKSHPELFDKEHKNLWQIEGAIWQRYVKRMMNKPGCEVTKEDGKVIWKFLSEDSRERKLEKQKEWTAHREKLLSEFKKNHPGRYKELYAH
ncbi:MAG: hypothetical protein AUJ52_00945 [Elusimicrobia bacterium CG1_02_63_36]|nr:MAG: hypothetical protein AUJ52_00945 [Elusimicrobia bacterium CG1_02_63_36]PIP84393.1 MAG: hypothetical protein COR54_04305 [Elusimicrobia bacterium CG22_combo_CG10-13_8_21_14_all_63_91]PJA18646.1 MAG: hypothetical protein COX66_00575 [Elusimicrobia bacterium CG_4_10_14_0_2_um_filter_63_34]PJB23390.1 MAG: hypothetical protein CO113_18290 [Elusimicrobia bacterium CG_4_9_14_3_um_filter_62_55]